MQFLTDVQRKQVLDMERHNIWLLLKASDPAWPYPCACRDCQVVTL